MKKLISIVLAIMTLAGLMIPVFAGAETAETTTMWVNCSNGKTLNVRESANGRVLYRIECGTRVEVQNKVSAPAGWAFVTVKGQKKGGYVKTQFLFDKIDFLLESAMGFTNLQQNSIIKIFSVAAVVFMPPTWIASIYGMNFSHMPELEWIFGYPFSIGLMIVSAFATYLFFRKKGWL